jgi:SAM-dependent methyltransferase
MQPDTYYMLAARDATYWWHRARRAMCAALLRRNGLATGARWLDLGCGPGGNLHLLAGMDPALMVGVDLSPIALQLARSGASTRALVRADICRGLPFADASFDVATIFNVLYHGWVERESDVLCEVARVLRPGGLALVTEPAFVMLARDMDVIGMARRRYRRRELSAMCRAGGLDVLFSSYFSSFGFAPLLAFNFARRIGARRRNPAALALDMKPLPWIANEALYRVASLEGGLIARGLSVPLGTTLVCVVRKP